MKNGFFPAGILLIVLVSGCIYSVDPRALASTRPTPAANSGAPGANPAPSNPGSVFLSMREVTKHTAASDCWIIINSNVYNLSSYVTHPGGDAYIPYCGTDATQAFDTKGGRGNSHSANANALLQSFELGSLDQTIPVPATNPADSNPPSRPPASNREDSDESEYD